LSWPAPRCRKLVKHGAAVTVNTDLALKLPPARVLFDRDMWQVAENGI